MLRRLIKLEKFGPPEVMSWVEAPVPERGPGEVVVAVEAIGINFGDTMVRRGEYRRDQGLEYIPGFEVAGTVVTGPRDGPAPGSRVLAFTESGGGYADHVVVPRSRVFDVHPDLTAIDAASIFVQGVTAWYSVHRYGGVEPDDFVLVHGASGGLGSACVQLVKHVGAKAIATASTEEKLEAAVKFGAFATALANPGTLSDEVREITAGAGCDVVLDGIGGPLFKPSMSALALNGRFVVMGSASQQPALLDVRALMPRGQTISGVLVARVAEQDEREPQRAFDEIQELFVAGKLRPLTTVRGPDELVEVHELMEARKLTGKVVIDMQNGAGTCAPGWLKR